MRSGPLTPTNTSAPFMTSLMVPIFREVFVFAANHSFAELKNDVYIHTFDVLTALKKFHSLEGSLITWQ